MIYTKRRVARHRMMRRTVIINNIKDTAASIKAFIPDIIATVGIVFGVFYLIPFFFTIIAATFK